MNKNSRLRKSLLAMSNYYSSTLAKPSYEWPPFDITSKVMLKMIELSEIISGNSNLALTARGIKSLRDE